jgi:hypothetical protein
VLARIEFDRRLNVFFRLKIGLLLVVFLVAPLMAQDEDPTHGVTPGGFAVLPADTFADGPPSGAMTSDSGEAAFENQPVQGVSAILPADTSNWLIMSDNGFGSQVNSSDYHLRLYEVSVNFVTGTVLAAVGDPESHRMTTNLSC